MTNELRKLIYRRDGFMCALCGNGSNLQVHHFIHRGHGGSDHPHNLVTLCSTCHAQSHGMLLDGPDMNVETVNQAIVEYLADYYADMGEAWNPWLRTDATPERLDHEPGDNSFILPARWRGR